MIFSKQATLERGVQKPIILSFESSWFIFFLLSSETRFFLALGCSRYRIILNDCKVSMDWEIKIRRNEDKVSSFENF